MSANAGPLAGLKVVDLADSSGVYGSKALSDLGADVTRVEPPAGDPLRARGPFLGELEGPDRSLYFSFMNTSKSSVVIDHATPEGRDALHRLALGSDIVYFSGEAADYDALGLAQLRETTSSLVVVSVTPFGLTGPRRSWRGSDLTAWAAGGLALICGDPDRAPLAPAPAAELAYVAAGQLAALAAVAAARQAKRTGVGQEVDVSVQESVLAMSGESGIITGFLDDLIPRRRCGSRRSTTAPFGHYPAADGFAAVMAPMPSHWEALSAWIHEVTGNDSVLDPALKGGPQARAGDMADVVAVFTEEFSAKLTRQELFTEGQRRGIPITPVNDAASVLADPYLEESGFWAELEVDGDKVRSPGAPYRFSRSAWKPGSAPRMADRRDVTEPFRDRFPGP